MYIFFFFSSRRRHTRFDCDWSSDVCSSDLPKPDKCIVIRHPAATSLLSKLKGTETCLMSKDKRKTAVVTGASAGVGRVTARLFAKKGWDLGLIARGHAGLEAARREAEDLGIRALALPTD